LTANSGGFRTGPSCPGAPRQCRRPQSASPRSGESLSCRQRLLRDRASGPRRPHHMAALGMARRRAHRGTAPGAL